MKVKTKEQARRRRHFRVRRKLNGTADRPRMCVYVSNKHVYVQVIDDAAGSTLAAASSVEKDMRKKLKTGGNIEAAAEVGKLIAERATKAGVSEVVFDRGGYAFHGRVKALADAAREGGLKF